LTNPSRASVISVIRRHRSDCSADCGAARRRAGMFLILERSFFGMANSFLRE
jgi:hypothetical protein